MGEGSSNGNSDLLALVLTAAREISRHDDPVQVTRIALTHGRKILHFDRSLAASRRDMEPGQIRIIRSDAPCTDFHDPTGREEFPPLSGGLLATLLYAGEPKIIDELIVAPDDPSARYLEGMKSMAAIPQFRGGEAVDMVFHLRRAPAAYHADRFAELVLISSLFGQSINNLARAHELAKAEQAIKEQYDIIAKLSTNVMNSAMDLKDYSKTLERRVRERTAELNEANLDAIYMLALASEAKDQDTGDHLRRIQGLTRTLALELGMDHHEADELGRASILHDVGKIHVPDAILKKPGKLTPEEMATMQSHTVAGERILGDNAYFASARRIARSHHENFDGSGYPDRAAGQSIAVEARIVHLADVYDALISPRVYKAAWTPREATDFIREGAGQMFDPDVVRAFESAMQRQASSPPSPAAVEPEPVPPAA
jgi:HD-GYP domain-containing protein (c-di-GMP phosphodiesterase class II)